MSTPPSPLVAARAVSRTYLVGDVRVAALDDVSLAVAEGRFVAITGASGSGKSTFLNLLGGLDTPTSGTIEVAGAVISAMDRGALARYRRFGAGMIFQSFNLVAARTALALLGFHCGIREVIIPDLSWTYEHCFPEVTAVPLNAMSR